MRWPSRVRLAWNWLRRPSEVDHALRRRQGIWLACGLSVLRLAAAPALWLAVSHNLMTWAVGLFLLASVTDLLDGYLARRLVACTVLGAYLDASADLLVVLAALGAFARRGLYPLWSLYLIAFMFAQFVLTSRLGRPIYDPLGKYLGAFLFVVVGITLVLPEPVVCRVLLFGIVAICLLSLRSRALYLLAGWKR